VDSVAPSDKIIMKLLDIRGGLQFNMGSEPQCRRGIFPFQSFTFGTAEGFNL
jgi:hypothetical protein